MATNPTPHQRAVSATVRALMERTPLPGGGRPTITEVATGLGENQPTVSRKLGGTRAWSVEDVFSLAAYFQITPGKLLDLVAEEVPHQEKLDRALS